MVRQSQETLCSVDSQGFKMRWGMAEAGSLRFSPVYFQYRSFRVGANSEYVRQGVQNWFAHSFLTQQRSIPSLSRNWSSYFQYQNENLFTSW